MLHLIFSSSKKFTETRWWKILNQNNQPDEQNFLKKKIIIINK